MLSKTLLQYQNQVVSAPAPTPPWDQSVPGRRDNTPSVANITTYITIKNYVEITNQTGKREEGKEERGGEGGHPIVA